MKRKDMFFPELYRAGCYDWFTGFCEGEGCFQIVRSFTAYSRRYRPRFTLAQKIEMADFMTELRERLGFGRVYFSHTICTFYVDSKADLKQLVKVLDGRIRGPKKDEFPVWKKAVEVYCRDGYQTWSGWPKMAKELHELKGKSGRRGVVHAY